jgi:deazaflavin-dependent oxidoreductase (nitroreductase family)
MSTGDGPIQPPGPGRVEPLKVPPGSNVFNAVVSWLSRLGIPLGPNALLSVRGRKSGIARTTPIAILEIGDRRFVQSPYGDVQWTRNLAAAGEATLTTGRRTERVSAARLSQAEAATFYGETLPPYLNRSFFTRFIVGRILGMAALAKDPAGAAATHPVFELQHLE